MSKKQKSFKKVVDFYIKIMYYLEVGEREKPKERTVKTKQKTRQ